MDSILDKFFLILIFNKCFINVTIQTDPRLLKSQLQIVVIIIVIKRKLCSLHKFFFLIVFSCPRRPNLGREGRPIVLRANHFQISMPRGFVHHYDINIQPDKCPRKVNREIIETMVHAYSKIFGTLKPVFDGRQNLYTRDPLPIGNDRVELEVIYFFITAILFWLLF